MNVQQFCQSKHWDFKCYLHKFQRSFSLKYERMWSCKRLYTSFCLNRVLSKVGDLKRKEIKQAWMSFRYMVVIQNMQTKTVYILLEQIKRGNLMVHRVVCPLPLVKSPLWYHSITFTCSLFNQLSQSSRALWCEYKAVKLILESELIQVDPS